MLLNDVVQHWHCMCETLHRYLSTYCLLIYCAASFPIWCMFHWRIHHCCTKSGFVFHCQLSNPSKKWYKSFCPLSSKSTYGLCIVTVGYLGFFTVLKYTYLFCQNFQNTLYHWTKKFRKFISLRWRLKFDLRCSMDTVSGYQKKIQT